MNNSAIMGKYVLEHEIDHETGIIEGHDLQGLGINRT